MGSDTKTVKNSLTVLVHDNQAWVTGPVPGHTGSLVVLTVTGKKDSPKLDFVTGGLPTKAPQENK
jgi:ribosomal protein L3